MLTDDCPGARATFDGQVGVFIDGQINPPLENVQVIIKTNASDDPKESITVYSNKQGIYR